MSESTVAATDTPPAEQVLEVVRQMVREIHPDQFHPVTLHTSFERDLAFDSLARVELMLRVGKAFGVELPSEALSEADTPRDVLRFLGHAPPEQGAAPATALGTAQTVDLPDSAQTLVEVLEWQVAHQPDRLHILLHDEQHREQAIHYRDLQDAARAIAAGLARQGLQPRQTVALMLPTGREYLACFFGVMLAGGIPVPIYPPARLAQIEDHLKRHARILSNAEAVLMITITQAKPVALMLQAAVPSLRAIVTPGEVSATPTPFSLSAAWRRHRISAIHVGQHRRSQRCGIDPRQPAGQHTRTRASVAGGRWTTCSSPGCRSTTTWA